MEERGERERERKTTLNCSLYYEVFSIRWRFTVERRIRIYNDSVSERSSPNGLLCPSVVRRWRCWSHVVADHVRVCAANVSKQVRLLVRTHTTHVIRFPHVRMLAQVHILLANARRAKRILFCSPMNVSTGSVCPLVYFVLIAVGQVLNLATGNCFLLRIFSIFSPIKENNLLNLTSTHALESTFC